MSRKRAWRERAKEKRTPSTDAQREHELEMRNNRNLARWLDKYDDYIQGDDYVMPSKPF